MAVAARLRYDAVTRATARFNAIVPGLAFAFVLFVVGLPLLFVLYASIRSDAPGVPLSGFSLSHWAELGDPRQRVALANTAQIAIFCTVMSIAIGVVMAWLVARTDLPWRGPIGSLVVLPLLVSPLFTGMAWIILAAPRAGWINAAFSRFTGGEAPLFDVYSLTGIVFVLTLH